MSKPGIVQCALKLAGIIVALSIAFSIRPANAFVVFSDLIVFTTPDVNLNNMTAPQFAAAQAGFGARILLHVRHRGARGGRTTSVHYRYRQSSDRESAPPARRPASQPA